MCSYATLEYANEYHEKRPSSNAWFLLTEEQRMQRLVGASDFIDNNFTFKDNLNEKVKEGKEEAPKRLKDATCATAVKRDLVVGKSRLKDRVKVDVIEVQYSQNESAYNDGLQEIRSILEPLLSSNSALFKRVIR